MRRYSFGLMKARGYAIALGTVAALSLMAGPASAAVFADLGVNPRSTQGDFSNSVGGALFSDQYTFQLVGSPLFVTFASATNVFAAPSDFITNFTGQLFQQVGAVGPGGGADIPVSAVVAAVPCQQNPTGCQILAGSALLAAGNYYLQLAGIGGGTSGYGGTLTTQGIGVVPLPAALPLFATGLAAMGLLGWRRRRKAQAGA
jgi:hypothetical protein